MRYLVRALDATSYQVKDIAFDASSETHARQWIENQGFTPLSVRVDRRLQLARRRRFNVALFVQELATLMSAGMTVVEAIDTLTAKAREPDLMPLQLILTRLNEGKPLSDALESCGSSIPPILIAAVRASETTGQVVQALRDYLRYDGMIQALMRKTVSSAIYPAVVVAFGLVITLLLLGYVVPRFAGLYGENLQSASAATKVLLSVASTLRDYGVWVALAFALASCMIVFSVVSGNFWRTILPWLMKIKALYQVVRVFALARLYRGLEFLIKGGYTVPDALQLATPIARQGGLGDGLERARLRVTDGKLLSESLAVEGLTDVVSERLLAVGERSGNIVPVLDALGDYYSTKFENTIDRLSRIVEPLLLMLVGAFVGLIVLLMYMPVFDLAGSL